MEKLIVLFTQIHSILNSLFEEAKLSLLRVDNNQKKTRLTWEVATSQLLIKVSTVIEILIMLFDSEVTAKLLLRKVFDKLVELMKE